MKSFTLKIISPGSVIFDGACSSLIFNAPDGKYGIQANHSPVISSVCAGEIIIKSEADEKTLTLSEGILKFEDNAAVILTQR